jgi:hypothetical protein
MLPANSRSSSSSCVDVKAVRRRLLDASPSKSSLSSSSEANHNNDDNNDLAEVMGVQSGVSEGIEDGCRLPALQVGHP